MFLFQTLDVQAVLILLETLETENKGFDSDVTARAWLSKIEKYRQFIERFFAIFEKPPTDLHAFGEASTRIIAQCKYVARSVTKLS